MYIKHVGWSRIQKKPEGLGFRDLGFWGELVEGRQKGLRHERVSMEGLGFRVAYAYVL